MLIVVIRLGHIRAPFIQVMNERALNLIVVRPTILHKIDLCVALF